MNLLKKVQIILGILLEHKNLIIFMVSFCSILMCAISNYIIKSYTKTSKSKNKTKNNPNVK